MWKSMLELDDDLDEHLDRRTGGNDNNSMISREGMQKYLRDTFA